MKAEKWINEIKLLILDSGQPLPLKAEHILLRKEIDAQTSAAHLEFMELVEYVVFQSIFRRAEAGQAFGSEAKIKEQFGHSLEENYGVTKGPFLNLARAYWTFKMELADLRDELPGSALLLVLEKVELKFGSVFFPTPGPYGPPNVGATKGSKRTFGGICTKS